MDNTIRKLIVIIWILSLVFALSSCHAKNQGVSGDFDAEPDAVIDHTETFIDTVAETETRETDSHYGYSRLTDEQKDIYNLLKSGLPVGEYTFDASKKYSDIFRARYYYYKDYGELGAFGTYNSMNIGIQISDYYVKSHSEYTDYSFGKKLLAVPAVGEMIELDGEAVPVDGLSLSFSGVGGYTSEEVSEMERQFLAGAERWLAELPGEDASDSEKVNAIANLICDKTIYEETTMGETPYGAVVKGKIYCEGYARTFRYFANKLGIESILVSGESFSEGHMWNKVKVDGKWYNIDVTWMDTGVEGFYNYDYFLKSDDYFRNDHLFHASGDLYIEPDEWSKGYEMPLSPENYGE